MLAAVLLVCSLQILPQVQAKQERKTTRIDSMMIRIEKKLARLDSLMRADSSKRAESEKPNGGKRKR